MAGNRQGDEYADAVLREVTAFANGGLDAESIEKALRHACSATQKQMAALEAVNYEQHTVTGACASCGSKQPFVLPVPNATEVARAVAHTTKAVDELYRLMSFAEGRPDSRPDLGGGNRDLLSLLTPDQLKTFEGWINAAHGRI